MRGADITQEALFTTVHLETFVPADHPLRPIRAMVNEALGRMSWLFDAMYAEGVRELGITPHVACNDSGNRSSRIDGRTTRHAGYAVSQDKRKQIEEHFGWGKTVGGLVQTMYRGLERVGQHFCLTMIGSNLVRMRTLALAAGPSG